MGCYDQKNDPYYLKPIILTVYNWSKLLVWIVLGYFFARGPCLIKGPGPENMYNLIDIPINITNATGIPKLISFVCAIGECFGPGLGIFLIPLLTIGSDYFYRIYDTCKGQERDMRQCGCTEKTTERRLKFLLPVIFVDILSVMTLAPFSNVYPFTVASLTNCPGAYILILARMLFYSLGLAVPTIYAQLHWQKNNLQYLPFLKFAGTLIAFALNVCTVSSSLATFFKVAFYQEMAVRYSYLVFTALVAVIALLNSYVKVLSMIKFCINKFDLWKRFFKYAGHASFLSASVASIGLITLNAYIFAKSPNAEDRLLARSSLIITCITFVFSFRHFLLSEFCGRTPLGEYCLLKCLYKVDTGCCGLRNKLKKEHEQRDQERKKRQTYKITNPMPETEKNMEQIPYNRME